MSIFLSSILLAAAAAGPQGASEPATNPKICRDMITSSSRLRTIRVCKTRVAWQRWEKCHSATRYCAPPKQSTVQVASLPNDKLLCKYLKETGSRLGQQKVCATQRQWDVGEQETQETIRDRQNRSSLTSETPSSPPGLGGGPR